MANSINTNYGAIVALQSLNRTNTELDGVQKRVSTGYRVADAKDDGAAFSVAQGLRGDVKGYEAVNERLGVAKGLLAVAQAGAQGISDTVGEIKKVLVKMTDENLSTDQFAQYKADYDALVTEIGNYIDQSSYNGKNLLKDTTDVKVVSTIAGDQITLNAQSMATTALTSPADAAAAKTLLGGGLVTFETAVSTALSEIGANIRSVDNQDAFTKVLSDAVQTGIGAIVDADLAKESARLQALQIRQQLGTQALSIANQAPSALLSLFR